MISNPLTELYRLVVVSGPNIDSFSKCSTKSTPRKSNPAQNFANFNQIKKNSLHHRQHYQLHHYHQYYNHQLNRLRLIRYNNSFGSSPSGRLGLPPPPPSSILVISFSLATLVRLYNSLASLDYYYHHSNSAVVDSPPFGRFVI